MTDKYRLVLKGPAVDREKAERIRKLCVSAPAMRDELLAGISAAELVLANWSNGDLASAVNGLEEWAEGARATLEEATS